MPVNGGSVGVTVMVPADIVHRDSDRRIIAVFHSLRELRGGGTAGDVLDRLDRSEYPITLRTVRRDLWFLSRLGLVDVEEQSSVRYWKARSSANGFKERPSADAHEARVAVR